MADLAGTPTDADGAQQVPGARSGRHALSTTALVCGLALMVVGTFLPWLRTGLATRNSFRAAGLIDRLLHPPGAAGVILSIWPGVVLVCAAALALIALGLRRTALSFAGLVALAVGAVAITLLLLPARSYASVARTGPAVTAVGAGLVLVDIAIGVLGQLRRGRR